MKPWGAPMCFVVCVPNTALLDAWYPVLAYLKREVENLQIHLVFPNASKLLRLNPDDAIAQFSDSVSESAVLVGRDGRTYVASGIGAAHGLARRHKRFRKSGIAWFLDPVVLRARIRGVLLRRQTTKQATAVCYSLKSRHKLPGRGWLDANFPGPRYSISHGLKRTPQLVEFQHRIDVSDARRFAAESDQAVYVFSESEIEAVTTVFGVPRERIHVTGVPRLDSHARQFYPAGGAPPAARSTVLLISRRATSRAMQQSSSSDYLPLGTKSAQIRTVLDACRKLGLQLLARPHPSENTSELLEALPAESRGIDWDITGLHPQQLANTVSFGVSFYSSVPVELLTLGVPSIEFRVTKTELVTPEESLGLVHRANSNDEFYRLASEIHHSRENAVKRLRQNLFELYANPDGAVERIGDEIASVLRRRAETGARGKCRERLRRSRGWETGSGRSQLSPY